MKWVWSEVKVEVAVEDWMRKAVIIYPMLGGKAEEESAGNEVVRVAWLYRRRKLYYIFHISSMKANCSNNHEDANSVKHIKAHTHGATHTHGDNYAKKSTQRWMYLLDASSRGIRSSMVLARVCKPILEYLTFQMYVRLRRTGWRRDLGREEI